MLSSLAAAGKWLGRERGRACDALLCMCALTGPAGGFGFGRLLLGGWGCMHHACSEGHKRSKRRKGMKQLTWRFPSSTPTMPLLALAAAAATRPPAAAAAVLALPAPPPIRQRLLRVLRSCPRPERFARFTS